MLSPTAPPAKVIIVCISSSKLAGGVPTTTPSEVNGNVPLNWLSNSVMFCCMFMMARFFSCCAGLIEASCAW